MQLTRIVRSYTMDLQTTSIIKARILMLLSSDWLLNLFRSQLNAQDWWLRTVYLPLTRQGSHVDAGGGAVFGNNYQGNGNCFLTNKWAVVLGGVISLVWITEWIVFQTWWLRSTVIETKPFYNQTARLYFGILENGVLSTYIGEGQAQSLQAVVLGYNIWSF